MRRRNRDAADLFALRCSECGRQLTRTHSGYLACPAGHGRLVNDTDGPVDATDELDGLFDLALTGADHVE